MFASEGSWFIISAAFVPVIGFAAAFYLKQPVGFLITFIGLVLFGFMLYFFRDPKVKAPAQDSFVSPTDGTILSVDELEDGKKKIVIFLSLFDVHALRSPAAGKIIEKVHLPGKYHPAYKEEAGKENEHIRIDLQTESGVVRFWAMSGLVARRIVTRVKTGDVLSAGQRIGFIRFGSRSEIEFPVGFDVQVRQGDKVKAGNTILAIPAKESIQLEQEIEALSTVDFDQVEVSGA